MEQSKEREPALVVCRFSRSQRPGARGRRHQEARSAPCKFDAIPMQPAAAGNSGSWRSGRDRDCGLLATPDARVGADFVAIAGVARRSTAST